MSSPIVNGLATVYPNETPFDTDVLRCGLYKMVDVAELAQTVLGTGLGNPVQVCGLACTPVSPPGLQVVLGVGTIYAFVDYLANAWGSINADTSADHQLYKQGILLNPVTLNTPAPAGVGNYIIYLLEVQFQENDVNSISRPYFNPSNPSSPTYTNASDTRQQIVFAQIKAGTASPSPSPPSVDAGFTALYYIEVAHGQTSIITGNITVVPNAPFITESLPLKASILNVQYNGYIYSADTGTANTYVATLTPAVAALTVGLQVLLKVVHTNTGASTLNVNGLGATTITYPNGGAIGASDMVAGQLAILMYDGTNFQLQNPLSGIVSDIPSGTILDFGGSAAPTGFLACNGAAISRTTYAALFAAIGTIWGVGDGSTTFNIPSFTDQIAMSTGTNAVGASVGSNTSAALIAHTHSFPNTYVAASASDFASEPYTNGAGPGYAAVGNSNDVVGITATNSSGSGANFSIIQASNIVTKIIKT